MSSYSCHLSKLIYRDSRLKKKGCYVAKEISLPFAPFIGLEVWLETGLYPEKIVKVSHDVSKNSFSCDLEDNAAGFSNTYENYKQSYLDDGWSTNGDMD